MSKELTAERLRELLLYDPETGVFTRRIGAGSARAGVLAGSAHIEYYRAIHVDGRSYLAHRLAWLYRRKLWVKK